MNINELLQPDPKIKAENWRAYRELLERLPELGPADKAKLQQLVKELGLTAGDVENHVHSLRRRREHAAALRELERAKTAAAENSLKVREYHEKRSQILAQFDAAGAPILRRGMELDQALQNAIMSASGGDREEMDYPDFYGVALPAPRPPVSQAQYDREVHLSQLQNILAVVRDDLRSGRAKREQFDDPTNDALTESFATGLANPTDFPPAASVDPRKPEALRIAGRMLKAQAEAKRGEGITVFPDEALKLVRFGVKVGWLKADLSPAD